jgi:hypothetical protein
VRGRFRANNSDAVRRATLNGHDVALLSHLLIADDIGAGRLRVVMQAFPPARFPTVVYPSRRNLPPRVRAVIDFLREVVQADAAMRDDGNEQPRSHSEMSGPIDSDTARAVSPDTVVSTCFFQRVTVPGMCIGEGTLAAQ